MVAATGRPAASDPWPHPAWGASSSGGPEVLFTFDDGPDPGRTERVLEVLAEHDVKAIFFMVGRRLRGPKYGAAGKALVDKILDAGHLPANHTIDHAHLCAGRKAEAERQLDGARDLIETVARMPVVLFRAPYGDRCRRLEAMLADRRLAHTHWDMDPQEWKTQDPGFTKRYVINRLAELEGRAVLLLHDTKAATVRALPEILDWLAKENERRVKQGRRPIRVLDPSEVVLEKLAPATLPLLEDMVTRTRAFAPDLLRRAAPLARPPTPPAVSLEGHAAPTPPPALTP
jgi:peptidoglycan/xylan/chitin deacetylase (PgdA/CDA1 family)